MSIENNQEIVRQLYTAVSASKNQPISYVHRSSGFTQYTVAAKPSSLKAFNRFFSSVSTALPDYKLTLENVIVNGDKVLARYTICGTHQKDFMGVAATHEQITITGIDIFRIDNGKVVEHWDAAHQITAYPSNSPEFPSSSNIRYNNHLTVSSSQVAQS